MEAKDNSMGFDYEGDFGNVVPQQLIHFELEDSRIVTIEFMQTPNGAWVAEKFDAEDENLPEQPKQGWQSILNSFKKLVKTKDCQNSFFDEK
jgi:hypothetical protein